MLSTSFRFLLLGFIIPICVACGNRSKPVTVTGEGDVYAPEFASGFTISSYGENSSILKVTNPWQGAENVAIEVFISRQGEFPPTDFEGIVVQAPLERVVCMSSSYVAFIDEIGEVDRIVGVSGARYISNEKIGLRYASGIVKDVGYDMNINFELVATLDPDLVFIYGVADDESSMTRKLGEMGIATLYIGDYIEESPLGKAEWIVAFGELFDRREEALARFGSVRDDYQAVRQMVCERNPVKDPVVMLNAPWRDTWFVPGDRSYMVRLITDAGGTYAAAGKDSEVSRPVSTETALLFATRSDFWLNPGAVSDLAELKSLNPLFAEIPPVKNKRVFGCNRRSTPGGGSDFWESGAVKPNVILRDLVTILHPELLDGHELYYYEQLD